MTQPTPRVSDEELCSGLPLYDGPDADQGCHAHLMKGTSLTDIDFSQTPREDALNVIHKLHDLRGGFSATEQQFFDQVMSYFITKVSDDPSAQALLADVPDGSELLDDVAGFAVTEGGDPVASWDTVWTITGGPDHCLTIIRMIPH